MKPHLLFLLLLIDPALGIASNLSNCLDGHYPSLCDKSVLSAQQIKQVEKAEHRANLQTCLDGNYPSLCRHGDLTPAEADRVNNAERAANLRTCLDGNYPSLCRHGDLTEAESHRVYRAEHDANLRICLDGRYPTLCRHGDLSQEEAARTSEAEASHPKPRNSPDHQNTGSASSECESGHWIDSVMDDGGLIKLEDGSLWKVDDSDTIDSDLWLPTSEIVICGGKLINTDDSESVYAVKIH